MFGSLMRMPHRDRTDAANKLREIADVVEDGPEYANLNVIETEKLLLIQYTVHGSNIYAPRARHPVAVDHSYKSRD